MAIFNYSIFWRYVVQPFLRCLAGLTFSMNRQLEINDMNPQAANGRVPPSWGPEIEKSYAFRYYEADALLWCIASDADEIRKGPNLALRLTGSAKMIMRGPPYFISGCNC